MVTLDQASPTLLLVSAFVGIVVAFGAFRIFSKKKKYRYVGKVKSLWIYPVKSCKGIRVKEAECTQLGLKRNDLSDRHWAISTASGSFVTQRQEPTMALVEPSVKGTVMTLRAPGMEPISFEAFPEPNDSNQTKITIWGYDCPSVNVDARAGKWFDAYLKREGTRMHYSSHALGKKDCFDIKEIKKYSPQKGDICAFPDASGYMILSSKSIDYINSKLEKPVSVMNYRPNILLDVPEAFAEDAWYKVKIGDAAFRALEHCVRCVLTTVIPHEGKKDEKGEPLATLKKYRSKEGYGTDPCFGMLHTLENAGTIKVGDPVYALDG